MADLRMLPTVHQAFTDALKASGDNPKAWTPCPRCGSVRVRHWSRYGSDARVRMLAAGGVVVAMVISAIFIITLILIPLLLLMAPFLVAFAPAILAGNSFCRDCHFRWWKRDVLQWVEASHT